MKYLKIFEEFNEFQLDEITKQEYYSILDNNPLVYIPESKVLEFKSKLSKEYKLGYGRASVKDTVEFFRAEYVKEIDYHITSKTFSIKKKSLVDDEPCYIMSYHYEEFTSFEAPQSHIETLPNQERIFFEKKSYYRFEESDFNQMCENPQILLDYLEKDIIKESFEYDEEKHIEKICKGWGVEIEDLEDLFIDFSDDGGKVKFFYMESKRLQITIRDIWKDLNDGDWFYNPLWDKRFGSIKLSLNRMGLDMNVNTKSLNHGRYANVRIFPMSDRKRTHSKTDIVKESFEVVMTKSTNEIISRYGLTMDDIEELFLEFSDDGYSVRIMPATAALIKTGLVVDVMGEFPESNKNSIDPFAPEIMTLVRRVIRNSTGLGLFLVESPKKLNIVRVKNKWTGTIRFIFKKR